MIHIVVGTRAQLIKMAPVMVELERQRLSYNFVLLAQHSETIDAIIAQFGLKRPDYVLGRRDGDVTSALALVVWALRTLLEGLFARRKVFKADKAGIALVHGDALPLFLGAVLAKAQGLRVAQVEAGLRSFNLRRPFPEELIRVVTARIGLIDIFYCQDQSAMNNVIPLGKTAVCTDYNTMLDALRLAGNSEVQAPPIAVEPYALVSLHRFESLSSEEALSGVVELIRRVADKLPVVFILHPPTRKTLERRGLIQQLESHPACQLHARLGFFEFHALLKKAEFVITDGGSNQEECAYLGKPCLLMRSETERREGLGANALLSNFEAETVDRFVDHYSKYRTGGVAPDVSPSRRIVEHLLRVI